jgi:hypothetical protein
MPGGGEIRDVKVSSYEEDGKVRIPGVARCVVGTK